MRQKLLRRNVVCAAAGASLILLFGSSSFAAGHGGGAGGGSAAHMSAEGRANTNGPMASDRDKGQARAEDRRSKQGDAHEKATAKSKPADKK